MMRRCIHSLFSLFLTGILFTTVGLIPAAAQEGIGSITGTVKDSSNGVLNGAHISLESQTISIASDVQLQLYINNLNSAKYTLTITYVGFSQFTKEVEVAPGQTANVDATLQLLRQDLQILVTAERP